MYLNFSFPLGSSGPSYSIRWWNKMGRVCKISVDPLWSKRGGQLLLLWGRAEPSQILKYKKNSNFPLASDCLSSPTGAQISYLFPSLLSRRSIYLGVRVKRPQNKDPGRPGFGLRISSLLLTSCVNSDTLLLSVCPLPLSLGGVPGREGSDGDKNS